MKKILAIMFAAALLVACGGEKKKELTVEEQAKAKVESVISAYEAGDEEKTYELLEAADEWYESLNEADKKKADEVIKNYEDKVIEIALSL